MMNSSSDEDEIDTKRALRLFGKGRRQYGAATLPRPKLTHSSREGRIPFPWPRHTNTKEVLSEYFGKSGVSKYMEIPAHLLESDSDDDLADSSGSSTHLLESDSDDDLADSSGLSGRSLLPPLALTVPISLKTTRNLSPPPLISSSGANPPSLSLHAEAKADSKDDHQFEEETVDPFYDLKIRYEIAANAIINDHAHRRNMTGGDPEAVAAIEDSLRNKMTNLHEKTQEKLDNLKHEAEGELAEVIADLPKPYRSWDVNDPHADTLRSRYPSILSKPTREEEQTERRLDARLAKFSNWLDDPATQQEIEKETEERRKRKAEEKRKLEEAMGRASSFKHKARVDDVPFDPETKEEAEHRKAEAKRIDTEAAAQVGQQVATQDALKKLKDTRPMIRLESIVYKAKNSASLDKQFDTLMQNYLTSDAVKSMYMTQIPKKYQSKEGWRQFKEDVRAHFGQRKIKLMAEKEKSNISAFPYSSDEDSSDSDVDNDKAADDKASPKTPRKSTTRSVELAKKFGEVTPAAAARAEDASAEPESDNDDIEEYLDVYSNEEEEKEFDSSTKTFKPVTKVLEASRVALTKHGKLSMKQRIDILEDLQEAVGKLRESERIKSVSFKKDGTLQYHGGTMSTFMLRDKVTKTLKVLRAGGGAKGSLR